VDGLTGIAGASGVGAVFLLAFVENMGFPVPAFPALILAGALSHGGDISLSWAICGATLGALIADALWFRIGLWRGRTVLAAICRLSLNPASCVEASEGRFARHRVTTILIAKFVPGLNAVTPPLAAVSGMPLRHFLIADAAGALVWATVGTGSGWLLGAAAMDSLTAMRGWLGWFVFGGFLFFLLWNGLSRYLLVRKYAIPRIPAGDLYGKIARGEDVLVIDLRSEDAFVASSVMVPSAVRVKPTVFAHAAKSLPADRELVFYCS
jgi:membrane protein DedA with SNARE-associated domain